MKKILLLCCLVLWASGCDRSATQEGQHYPWQIKVLANGNSQVFGIEFGKTTLQQATERFGRRHELALFESPDKSLSLEAFYNEVTMGGLSGKVILSFAMSDTTLAALRQRTGSKKRMESGAVRHALSLADKQELASQVISGLTYIPYVNLKPDMIEKRFGMAEETITIAKGKIHYLYPAKGLDLFFDEDGKELLQYVAPREFARLKRPLLQLPAPVDQKY